MLGLGQLDFAEIGSKLFFVIIGGLAVIIWYFIKRGVSRSKVHETADLYMKIAAMRAALRENGMSLEDAEELATYLTSKIKTIQPRRESPEVDNERIITQAEMNREAGAMAEAATANLKLALVELDRHLSPEEQNLSVETQEAWERYREMQAQLDSMIVEGGSMQPLVYSSSIERLTSDRTAFVRQMVKEREALLG